MNEEIKEFLKKAIVFDNVPRHIREEALRLHDTILVSEVNKAPSSEYVTFKLESYPILKIKEIEQLTLKGKSNSKYIAFIKNFRDYYPSALIDAKDFTDYLIANKVICNLRAR